MSALSQLSDYKNHSNFSIPMSQSIFQCVLPGLGEEKLLAVPKNKRCCVISATGNYAVAADTTASMPSDSEFTQTNSELNKPSIWLYPSDPNVSFPSISVLHFVSSDPVLITVSFYD